MSNVKAIPDGYSNVTPYLIVSDGAGAIDFYKTIFAASEVLRMPRPDGKVGHAELRIGASMIMLADENSATDVRGPQTYGGSPVSFLLYVERVDDVVQKAQAAGAKILRPLKNQFYGDRSATIEDPFGHQWTVATHVEDVAPEEMKKRMAELAHGSAGGQG